eukprot:6177420-Pleurochrysis_carterae.AAC.1
MAQRSGSTSSYDLHPSQQQSSVSTIWESKSSAKLLSGVTQKCAVHRYAMEQKYMAAYNMKKYIPRGWDHNQYAVEIYVDAALRNKSLERLDVVVEGMCRPRRDIERRDWWSKQGSDDSLLQPLPLPTASPAMHLGVRSYTS